MPDEPINITTDILIAIREDISSFRAAVDKRFDRVEGRLDQLEQTSRKHRHDAAAMMVIMRATVSHFNQRVGTVEERVSALETPKS
jgi:phage-related minor tail protein